CRGAPVGTPPPVSIDEVAERYVRLTLQLAQHQPSLVETWLGPPGWRPGARRPVSEIRTEMGEVTAAMATLAAGVAPSERFRYLQQQLEALDLAARRLSGESMRFAEEARAALGADAAEMVTRLGGHTNGSEQPAARIARADLQQRLSGRGPLHERYAAFRARHAIAPARIAPVLQAALDICRRRVVPHIPLPESETVQLDTTTGLGLEGRAIYEGDFRSRVLVDSSGPIDLARLVWLVAHETYPGHHVQHVLADRDVVPAQPERALHPSFGRHLLCAEGAAEAGAALLLDGAVFEEVCRDLAPVAGTRSDDVAELVAIHRAVAELDPAIAATARAYLDGDLGSEAAAEQLTARALVLDAQQFLFVIERQRTRLLAYPVGRRLVTAHVFDAPAARRWGRLADVATTMTLPSP
ncbi:MAG TPA: hypothetical protein VMO26_18770, partial [Vicinamibacterales bacterium]|nr:hypothetical protein [Vicinamibacterales bacterium]